MTRKFSAVQWLSFCYLERMSGGGLGLGWQVGGSAVLAAIFGCSLAPVALPLYTRRYYGKFNITSGVAEEVDDRTLSLVDDVSNVLGLRVDCSLTP